MMKEKVTPIGLDNKTLNIAEFDKGYTLGMVNCSMSGIARAGIERTSFPKAR